MNLMLGDCGSSPQAWGTERTPYLRCLCCRFIPTGMGNRVEIPNAEAIKTGSSPQAWGTVRLVGLAGRRLRFIPTGMGNRPFCVMMT